MWWLLVVTLWAQDVSLPPKPLQPVPFSSEDNCHAGGARLLEMLKADKPESIAAVYLACVPASNPLTEQ